MKAKPKPKSPPKKRKPASKRRRNPAAGMSTDLLARVGFQMLGAVIGDMLFDLHKGGPKKKGSKAKVVCMCGKEHEPGFCAGRPEDYAS